MTEEEAAMVLELHRKLVDAQSVLARCIQKMNQMPGSGDITGILARSTVNSISELLHHSIWLRCWLCCKNYFET